MLHLRVIFSTPSSRSDCLSKHSKCWFWSLQGQVFSDESLVGHMCVGTWNHWRSPGLQTVHQTCEPWPALPTGLDKVIASELQTLDAGSIPENGEWASWERPIRLGLAAEDRPVPIWISNGCNEVVYGDYSEWIAIQSLHAHAPGAPLCDLCYLPSHAFFGVDLVSIEDPLRIQNDRTGCAER